MNAFVVETPNVPGQLARLSETLADRGVNMLPYGIGGGGERWVTALVASDEDAAREALRDAGIAYREFPLLHVRMEDRPGETATYSRKLADAGVNIELWFPVDTTKESFTMAIAVDDPDKARQVLSEQVTEWTYA